jgi:hypothetical protein
MNSELLEYLRHLVTDPATPASIRVQLGIHLLNWAFGKPTNHK